MDEEGMGRHAKATPRFLHNLEDKDMTPQCQGCKKAPNQINELIEMAKAETEDAGEPVHPNEMAEMDGTYNPENGHFLCMECYIEKGMPSSRYGWTCP